MCEILFIKELYSIICDFLFKSKDIFLTLPKFTLYHLFVALLAIKQIYEQRYMFMLLKMCGIAV